MTYRKNNRGSYRIKKSFGTIACINVGKLDVPLGTTDKSLGDEVEKCLIEDLPSLGRDGALLLCDIRDRRRTGVEVYHLFRRQKARDVPIPHADLLTDAIPRFLASAKKKSGAPISDRTRHDYAGYFRLLVDCRPDAVVADLPDLLDSYRRRFVQPNSDGGFDCGEQFRKMKAACLAFARNTQIDKQYSSLWRDVAKVPVPPASDGKNDIALRVFEVRKLIERLPTPQMRNVAWTMALTGMQVGEYVGVWEVRANSVFIRGMKNNPRRREVPLLSTDISPEAFSYYQPHKKAIVRSVNGIGKPIPYKSFNREVRRASGGLLTAAVFRHSYRLWLREAGIDDWRADKYFGHKSGELKRRYAGHEVEKFIREDTTKISEYLEREWTEPSEALKPVKRIRLLTEVAA